MLIITFFFLCIISIVHYVYERIILPEIRLYYRNKLFILRDVVRLELLNDNKSDLDSARVLHDALNNSINRLHTLTISNRYVIIKKILSDANFRKKIEHEINIIKKTENQNLKKIYSEACTITNNMFVYNSLLSILYSLVPFLIIFLMSYIFKLPKWVLFFIKEIKRKEKIDVEALSFSSEKQFKKIITTA